MTAASDLRVGILGAGAMARHHAMAIARARLGARVVAVADQSAAARSAMAALAADAALYPDVECLLAEAKPDVVHVVTPPDTHTALARLAVEAGCHVYVEKPVASTAEDASALFALARERGRIVCAGHQLLYEEAARWSRALRSSLGQLSHVESYFAFRPVRRGPGGRARLLRADQQLLDVLPHPVYLLLDALESGAPGATELVSLDIGVGGTVHALFRRGQLAGVLTVTLVGRPVDSYLRLVGTNGSLHVDFVRGTVQRLIGPGVSGIEKVLSPYRVATQLVVDTTAVLTRRVVHRRRSYPGLAELFAEFYAAVRAGGEPPISVDSVIETVRVSEQVAAALAQLAARDVDPPLVSGRATVAVTGATGFLGRCVSEALAQSGANVIAIARRAPASWERLTGIRYVSADLAQPDTLDSVFACADVVIHCAAETAGGWEQHQTNSIDATRHALQAAAAAGARGFLHISSLAVLSPDRAGAALSEASPLCKDPRRAGPYVWGKLESERLAVQLGRELGIAVKVVRPGALVDYGHFEPPGRLGRRVGGLFVAVGSPGQRVGAVDVGFASRVLAWLATHFDEAPGVLNLVAPQPVTKRDLLRVLRAANPGLRVVWIPVQVLLGLSWLAIGAQRLLRPGRPSVNLAAAFAPQRLDASRIATLAARIGITTPSAAPLSPRAEVLPSPLTSGRPRRVHSPHFPPEGRGGRRGGEEGTGA